MPLENIKHREIPRILLCLCPFQGKNNFIFYYKMFVVKYVFYLTTSKYKTINSRTFLVQGHIVFEE